jgi:signal transduction histidine kinase/ligand-binding sensor domain-containing protein/CheY-like chemotaxis protein/AraC-like DNA-binding protein
LITRALTIIIIAILTAITGHVNAADTPTHRFETIETDADANTVYSITEDSCGLMWVGSNQGLNLYDGYKLHHRYTVGEASNTHIYCAVERDSRFYLGGNNGLLIYDLRTDSYITSNARFPREIRAVAFEDDNLLIGSLNGLYRYNIAKDQLTHITRGLPHNAVYAITADKHRPGNYYIGTYNGLGLLRRGSESLQTVNVAGNDKSTLNVFVNSLLYDSQRDVLWIGTEGALYCLSLKGTEKTIRTISALNGNSIKALAMNREGNIFIGTDNGLFTYDGTSTKHYLHDSRIATSLSNNVVWCLYVDSRNNVWAGTEYNISVIADNQNFEVFPLSEITGRGDGNQIYNIFRDSASNLWLGGTNGLIKCSLIDKSSTWFKPGDNAHPLPHNRIRNINEDRKGDIWIATDGSINRYDKAADKFITYSITDASHNFNANWAYGTLEDSDDHLWIGSYLGGMFCTDINKLKQSHATYIADKAYNSTCGLPNNFVNEFVRDNDGNIWIALYQSDKIVKIDHKTGALSRYDIQSTVSSTPSHILAAEDGKIWCSAQGCIARINPNGHIEKVFQIPTREKVNVFAMAIINNEIWISTSLGLWSFDMHSDTFSLLPVPARSYTSIYYDHVADQVYLGDVDQLTRVSPNISSSSSTTSPIILTELYVNDLRYQPDDFSIRNVTSLSLSHDENRLEIFFSDLNYSKGNRRQYEYRLVGQQNEWLPLDKDENSITVTNLSPAKYTLEIRQAGTHNSQIIFSLPITIRQPWYASAWARMIYVLILFGFIAWIINFIRVKQRLKFERISRVQAIESVKSRIDFLTNISHELKTPLSMIIGPISKMLNDTNDANQRRKLKNVYNNAMTLNTLIHRALEINRMETKDESMLIYSQVDIIEFTRGIFDNYREAFPNINFVYNSDIKTLPTEIDVVKMESVINNIISNACKYSSDKATIAMSLAVADENLIIKVSDDGIGIPAEERPLIFQRLFQSTRTSGSKEGTGIGLYLAKKYIEMHNGSIAVDANEGDGTIFSIVLPIRRPETSETEPAIDNSSADNRKMILIVDDNIAISKFIKDILSENYHCITATNGRAGLAVCGSMTPDLIIADVMMPVMDGIEMCRRIKANPQLAKVPIILLTAKDDSDTEAESINVGADTFMSKPFDAQMLTARVNQLLKATETIRSSVRVEMITEAKDVVAESADERTLADIAKVIEDNISDTDLNVTFVCDKLGLSSKQLYRLVKKYIGISPVDYIKQIRMKKAAMLLQQDKFTIAEVMYMVGFSSASYFSKCFSAQFDVTPRQYLENLKHKS